MTEKNNYDFRLDSISFENYKGFATKQTLDFKTTSRWKTPTTEKKQWTYSDQAKYKKMLGIWGKNSSGKTSIFEIVNRWKYNYKKINFIKEDFDLSWDEYLNLKYRHKGFTTKEFSSFNDQTKPISIALSFSSSDLSFIHVFEEKHNNLIKNKTFKNSKIIEEKIILKRYKNQILENNIEIWNSKKYGYGAKTFLKKIREVDEIKNSSNKIKVFIDLLEETNKYSVDEINSLVSEIEKINQEFSNYSLFSFSFGKNSKEKPTYYEILQKTTEILETFFSQTKVIEPASNNWRNFPHPIWGAEDQTIEEINSCLKELNAKKKDYKTLEKIVSTIVKNIDSNIESIEIEKSKETNNPEIKSIISYNKIKNYPEHLSTGTLQFLSLILNLYVTQLSQNTNYHQYIFIDELGLNWHTNLTKDFLNAVIEGFWDERTTLIFTSHDPNVGDILPSDSIYVINNENNLKRVSEIENKNGNFPRKDEKFSSNYLNDIMDIYHTNPSFKFDTLLELFQEEKKLDNERN